MSRRTRLFLLAVLLCGLIAAVLWLTTPPAEPEEPPAPPPVDVTEEPSPPPPEPTEELPDNPALEDDGLPHDQLFITVERQNYKDDDLQLLIPKLDVDEPVLAGTSEATLLKGLGLYDFAQLPGEGNRNVSIAGHRNGLRGGVITDNQPFYYLDTLEDGDALYLRDDANIYVYAYESTEIVEQDDWGPIYSQGYSCLTLTSCHPIGVADHRIVVRGRLMEVIDLTADYDYPAFIE